MEFSLVTVLYLVSIFAIVILTILFSIILYRVIKILGVAMEILTLYEKIKMLFWPSLLMLDTILSIIGRFVPSKDKSEK